MKSIYRRLELWGEGFRFYDLKEQTQYKVGPTTVPATTSNHISSVALEFNIPAGDKDGNGCSKQKLMLTLQLCKIQINFFACIKQNNIRLFVF
jgi:hypothetical protein